MCAWKSTMNIIYNDIGHDLLFITISCSQKSKNVFELGSLEDHTRPAGLSWMTHTHTRTPSTVREHRLEMTSFLCVKINVFISSVRRFLFPDPLIIPRVSVRYMSVLTSLVLFHLWWYMDFHLFDNMPVCDIIRSRVDIRNTR